MGTWAGRTNEGPWAMANDEKSHSLKSNTLVFECSQKSSLNCSDVILVSIRTEVWYQPLILDRFNNTSDVSKGEKMSFLKSCSKCNNRKF